MKRSRIIIESRINETDLNYEQFEENLMMALNKLSKDCPGFMWLNWQEREYDITGEDK